MKDAREAAFEQCALTHKEYVTYNAELAKGYAGELNRLEPIT